MSEDLKEIKLQKEKNWKFWKTVLVFTPLALTIPLWFLTAFLLHKNTDVWYLVPLLCVTFLSLFSCLLPIFVHKG